MVVHQSIVVIITNIRSIHCSLNLVHEWAYTDIVTWILIRTCYICKCPNMWFWISVSQTSSINIVNINGLWINSMVCGTWLQVLLDYYSSTDLRVLKILSSYGT